MMKYKSIALILCMTSLAFKCGGNQSLSERAVRAVASVPAVVRVLFPNADPKILEAVDAAGVAFNEFLSNQTADGWGKAENAWRAAEPLLTRLNNARLNQIIAVVDILLGQVSVSPTVAGGKSMAVVKVDFKESTVKDLERAIEEAKKAGK